MYSIFAWFGYEYPKDLLFKLIKSAGFAATMLWWNNDFGDDDFRKNPELARKASLFVENIHTPFDNANNLWLDNADGEAITQRMMQCVADCADNEIPTMVVHLSSGNTPPPYNTLGLDRVRRIADVAEKRRVNVALENLRRTDYLSYALDQIDSPRIGFCYDSGHQHCRTPDEDLLGKYGSRLMSLHLHDNDGYRGGTASDDDQHKLPFDGTIDWPRTMREIAETGYKGPISLEAANAGHENLSAEEFLRLAYERVDRLGQLIAFT